TGRCDLARRDPGGGTTCAQVAPWCGAPLLTRLGGPAPKTLNFHLVPLVADVGYFRIAPQLIGEEGITSRLLSSSTRCDNQQIYGVVNRSVTLYSPNSAFTEIMWKKGKDKVIHWQTGYNESVYPPFKGRVYLNRTSGNLIIFNLTLSDEDEYEMEILGLTMIRLDLKVLEPLPSPTLNCALSGENITVSCSIPENYKTHRELIRFSWRCSSAQCVNSSESTMHFQKTDDLSQKIECTIENQVSSAMSSLVLETYVPGDHSRTRYGLIAALLLLLLLLSIWPFMKCMCTFLKKIMFSYSNGFFKV
ncbi:lymphocyte function-associated antigen 3, partial [Pteropus vampyrus]|uniref:Lymphocyte function-associated antigen 3 n=1 Tax=Pteropus vampyrus TaxID=132908 RepID=A0A6P6CUW0_PTEVA